MENNVKFALLAFQASATGIIVCSCVHAGSYLCVLTLVKFNQSVLRNFLRLLQRSVEMGQNFLSNAEIAFIDERGGLSCTGDSVVHGWVSVGGTD
jgi:hypothetical protein